MKINVKSVRKSQAIIQAGIRANDLLKEAIPLYAMWGVVLSANSGHNTVDVELMNGVELRGIEVRSLEWAGANSIGYGERDLPPKNCPVLIIFPGGNIESGFVLCSTLNRFELKHKTELLVSGKETEHLRDRTGKKTILKINGVVVTIETTGKIEIEKSGGRAIVNADGSIEITPATGKDIKLAGGTIGANDFTNCPFSGAIHCTDVLLKVKVP